MTASSKPTVLTQYPLAQSGIGNTTGHGFGCAILALWFLLRVALAGPHREKPHPSSQINAGTAEPFRVSPPEAVAYPLELIFLS